jgi:hypothetical protein
VALASCGVSGAHADAASSAFPIQIRAERKPPMNTKSECGTDNFSRSQCMIRLILDDLKSNFKGDAGGGISGIKANSSTSFTVSLPKEERVEKYTYEFAIGPDGNPFIKSKNESVESHGR